MCLDTHLSFLDTRHFRYYEFSVGNNSFSQSGPHFINIEIQNDTTCIFICFITYFASSNFRVSKHRWGCLQGIAILRPLRSQNLNTSVHLMCFASRSRAASGQARRARTALASSWPLRSQTPDTRVNCIFVKVVPALLPARRGARVQRLSLRGHCGPRL